MTLTIDAVYENGVLKPTQPLPLEEHQQVKVNDHTAASLASRSAGLIRWVGDVETLGNQRGRNYFHGQPSLAQAHNSTGSGHLYQNRFKGFLV
jgi:predicted DNA-binding antitoxin AbrB/MazE fold protein